MRTTIAIVLLMAAPLQAQEVEGVPAVSPVQQEASSECWAVAAGRVAVRMMDGTTLHGTLLCLGKDDLVLSGDSISKYSLDAVREIVRPADPVWDGAVKGAAVGAIILALCGGECANEYLLRAMVGYAAFGAILDGVDTHRAVLYRPGEPRRVAANVRWRF
jgi:hypothetical protein